MSGALLMFSESLEANTPLGVGIIVKKVIVGIIYEDGTILEQREEGLAGRRLLLSS